MKAAIHGWHALLEVCCSLKGRFIDCCPKYSKMTCLSRGRSLAHLPSKSGNKMSTSAKRRVKTKRQVLNYLRVARSSYRS